MGSSYWGCQCAAADCGRAGSWMGPVSGWRSVRTGTTAPSGRRGSAALVCFMRSSFLLVWWPGAPLDAVGARPSCGWGSGDRADGAVGVGEGGGLDQAHPDQAGLVGGERALEHVEDDQASQRLGGDAVPAADQVGAER